MPKVFWGLLGATHVHMGKHLQAVIPPRATLVSRAPTEQPKVKLRVMTAPKGSTRTIVVGLLAASANPALRPSQGLPHALSARMASTLSGGRVQDDAIRVVMFNTPHTRRSRPVVWIVQLENTTRTAVAIIMERHLVWPCQHRLPQRLRQRLQQRLRLRCLRLLVRHQLRQRCHQTLRQRLRNNLCLKHQE